MRNEGELSSVRDAGEPARDGYDGRAAASRSFRLGEGPSTTR